MQSTHWTRTEREKSSTDARKNAMELMLLKPRIILLHTNPPSKGNNDDDDENRLVRVKTNGHNRI